jgi:hypothetical protein
VSPTVERLREAGLEEQVYSALGLAREHPYRPEGADVEAEWVRPARSLTVP